MCKKLILILFFSGIFFAGCDENILDPEYGTGDDYDIYREVLVNRFSESEYFVMLDDSTHGERFDSLYLQHIYEQIPGLSEEAMMDYIKKNNERIKLKNIPGFDRYVFRSEYKETEGNKVSMWFSRIGFDITKSQAVVTVGEIYAPLAGGGYLVFLKKSGAHWRIEKILGTWIS